MKPWPVFGGSVFALLLTRHYQQMGIAVSVVLGEILVMGSIVLLLRRRKLDPWGVVPEVKEAVA